MKSEDVCLGGVAYGDSVMVDVCGLCFEPMANHAIRRLERREAEATELLRSALEYIEVRNQLTREIDAWLEAGEEARKAELLRLLQRVTKP